MPRGRFITLEGGEGTGKSTQALRLAERLRASGREVLATREPGGSEGAEALRKLLLEGDPDRWSAVSEALLMYAARRDHLEKLIRPALARGAWVISDRFFDSARASPVSTGRSITRVRSGRSSPTTKRSSAASRPSGAPPPAP